MKSLNARLAIVAILIACSGFSAFGAGSQEPTDETPEFITVAVQAGAPEPAAYIPLGKTWEEKTGIRIEWIEIPQESQHDKLITALSNNTGVYDVLAVDNPWLPEFAAAGYIEPLDEYISETKKNDFFDGYLSMNSYKGNLYGIPHYMFAPIMLYRTDLFEKYGFRIPTPDNPLTKEELIKFSQIAMAGEDDGFYGTIVEGKRIASAAVHFIEYIYREGGVILDDNNIPHVNEAPVVRALQFMYDMVHTYKIAPEGALGLDHVDNHTLFMQGKLLMAINWPYAFSMTADPSQSNVSKDFAVTIPWKAEVSTSVAGGWSMALSSDSKRKDAAWDFIRFITETEQQYALRKINFQAPTSQSELTLLEADTDLTTLQRESLAAMSKAVDNGSLVPGIPQWSQIQDRLNVAMQEALGDQKTPQEALDDAQKDIEKILNL